LLSRCAFRVCIYETRHCVNSNDGHFIRSEHRRGYRLTGEFMQVYHASLRFRADACNFAGHNRSGGEGDERLEQLGRRGLPQARSPDSKVVQEERAPPVYPMTLISC
jgi:hypothetical protein